MDEQLIGITAFYSRMQKACDEAGSQAEWSRKHNLSPGYVCEVLNAKREPSQRVLDALKLKKVTAFAPTGG